MDVFTRQAFRGNQLAVVFDAAGLADRQMQAIAREFNYSETTFVLPAQESKHTAQIRIFTPTQEVPFAGHPNVGTAVALAQEYATSGVTDVSTFVFEEGAGIVEIQLLRRNGHVSGARIAAPRQLQTGQGVSREDAAECLTLDPSTVVEERHSPLVASVGLPFLIIELASREALRVAKPNLAAHERVLRVVGTDAVFAYLRDDVRTLQSRMFAPMDAILEDPATGSAAAATIALLAMLRPQPDEEMDWTVSQGVDMGRPSMIDGHTSKRAGAVQRVTISGEATRVMDGCIYC